MNNCGRISILKEFTAFRSDVIFIYIQPLQLTPSIIIADRWLIRFLLQITMPQAKYNDLQSREWYSNTLELSVLFEHETFLGQRNSFVWEIMICLLSPSFHKCSRYLSFAPSSNFFSSAKRNLEILYVFGRKASDRACYRNWKRETKDFEKVYPTNWMGDTYLVPGARFSKVPIINGPVKLLLFTWKIEVSIVLHSYMIKLSVNETKWSILLGQDPRSYSFYFDLNIWFRAQKSYRDFQETGPWASLLRAADAFRVTWAERGPVVRLEYVTEMHWPRRPGKSRMTRFLDYESLQSKTF